MRAYILIGFLLILSVLINSSDTSFLGYVWYDKLMHMSIGIFFLYTYRGLNPDDNLILVATVFTILYEIFVELIFQLPIAFVLESQNLSSTPKYVIENFIQKYSTVDEWLDVSSTWIGCLIGGKFETPPETQ